MKPIYFFSAVITIILSTGCTKNEEISDSEKKLIIKELQNRLDDYADAFKQKDWERMQHLWSDNPDFAYASDGSLSTNYDSIAIYRMQNYLPNVQDVPYFKILIESGTILSKNAASVISTFDWTQILTSGDTLRSKGTWLFVFKKDDNQWGVVHSAGTHIMY